MKNGITFIIPTINRGTLGRSIESLLNQTNPNWFAIVVFDGIEKYDFEDDRIISLKVDKIGESGKSGLVRNYGIKMACTEWIGFLDDDDTLTNDYVEKLFMQYSDKDLVVWKMIYTNGVVLPPENHKTLDYANVGISFCFKNKFENLFFDGNSLIEDLEFLKKLESLTDNWVISNDICYKIRH